MNLLQLPENQAAAMQTVRRALRLISKLFSGLGLLLLVVAVAIGVWRYHLLSDCVKTDATILSLSDGYPTVQFEADGETLEHTFSTVKSSTFRVGGTVEVAYQPGHPLQTVTFAGVRGYLVPILLGIVGLSFFVIGGGVPRMLARMFELPADKPVPWDEDAL